LITPSNEGGIIHSSNQKEVGFRAKPDFFLLSQTDNQATIAA
jgi:hypothetical protein